MKHIFYLFVLAALFVPAGYLGSEAVTELTEMTEARKERERLNRSRIMRILKADERYLFQQVVVGPGDDAPGQLDFRARAYRDGLGQAAYGAIRASCPLPAEGADCWELASLYVDGVSVHQDSAAATLSERDDPGASKLAGVTATDGQAGTLANAVPGADNKSRDLASDSTLEVTALTASGQASDQASDPAPSQALDQTRAGTLANAPAAQSLTDLRPTHSVRPSLVNARAAPRGEALAQLPQGTPLYMLDRQGGWGQFRVLDGEEAGLEIWIALSVLDSL